MKKLVVMGANNPEIIRLVEAIRSSGSDLLHLEGFVDNDLNKKGSSFFGYNVLGPPEILSQDLYRDCYVINNITRDCQTRKETTQQLLQIGCRFTSLVHPRTDTTRVLIGAGVVVHEGCVLSPCVQLKDHCAIMIGANIGHETVIDEYSFVGPGVTLCGLVHVYRESFVGAGAVVLPRLEIGPFARIGAGSVVIRKVKEGVSVFGNPARKYSPVDQ